jgi:hypothetical protein
MVQFIRTSIEDDTIATYDQDLWFHMDQRSQISINDDVLEIFWHPDTKRVFIRDIDDKLFFLTSPDIDKLTTRNVLDALNYNNDIVRLDWIDDYINLSNINHLDIPIEIVPLNQMTIYNTNNIRRRNSRCRHRRRSL